MVVYLVSYISTVLDRISILQQALKSSCSQITHMVQPEGGDGEEDQKKISVEVKLLFKHTHLIFTSSLSNIQVPTVAGGRDTLTNRVTWTWTTWLCLSACTDQEVHATAIRSLAELTARSIELFHKLAEMVLFSGGTTEASILSQWVLDVRHGGGLRCQPLTSQLHVVVLPQHLLSG